MFRGELNWWAKKYMPYIPSSTLTKTWSLGSTIMRSIGFEETMRKVCNVLHKLLVLTFTCN